MNVLEVFGACARSYKRGNLFYKEYRELPDWRWVEIVTACIILSNEEISPPLVTVYHSKRTIVWEKIVPLRSSMEELPDEVELSVADLKQQISILVERMHDLGYVHGDLHIGNIGVRNGNQAVLLDFDSIMRIGVDDAEDWVREYIRNGFEKDDVAILTDFISYEETCWQTDVLD